MGEIVTGQELPGGLNPRLESSYLQGSQDHQLLETTITEAFDDTARRYPDNDALVVVHQNIKWTYREYQQEIINFAAGLLSIGIGPGDRVGIWAPNCYEWCLAQFATARIGAVLVCINPAYRSYELEYALNKVACKALIAAEKFKESDYLGMLNTILPELCDSEPGQLQAKAIPALQSVIRMGSAESQGMYNFASLCRPPGDEALARMSEIQTALACTDAINVQFTSGTTGKPKGATLSHHNILNNGAVVASGMRLSPVDRLCIPVPLYHCFGMVMGNLACITHGAAAVFPGDSFDPLTTLQAVEAQRCTALHGVPTMFIAELDHPQFSQFDLSTLRTGIMAGSPCPVEVMHKVMNTMHLDEILIAYGQTETSPVNHMTLADDPVEKRVATVGRAGPRLEIKIVDDAGDISPVGQKGEICCRGYAVMLGYWNDTEQTEATIDNEGWLHSGDLGVMDEQGYVEIVGRIKDMIIRGGENIYPREVEEFLYSHPAIQEAQVIGVPDDKYGEQVCAWVKLSDGHSLAEDELRAFCRENITHFKVPRYFEFVDDFPMTVTGKIQKFKMREQMIKKLSLN